MGKVIGSLCELPEEASRTLVPRQLPKIITVAWLALGIASVVLALIAALVLRSERESTAVLHHLNLIALDLQDVLSDLADAKSEKRGYLLQGQPSSRENFERSRKALSLEFDRLTALVKNNPVERQEVERVRFLVQQELGELQRSIGRHTAAGSRAAFVKILTDRSRKLTEALRQSISGIDKQNEGMLARLTRRRRVRLTSALAGVSGALFLSACYLLIGQIIIARSASLHRGAEEALRAMPVGVFRCSRDLRYKWVSPSYAAWLGRLPEEIIGQPINSVLGQEALEAIAPHIEKVISGKREEFEDQMKYPGIGVRWIHAVYAPIRGQDNKVDGWIGVVADVTERREAEERLRESEERFRATFFQAAVGIAQTSIEGQWRLLNDRLCQILGYTREELLEKTFVEITHPDDRAASLEARDKLLSGEISSWSSEKRYIRKDGSTVWARLVASLARDQHNEPRYFVSVVEDITEKIQAERALQQSREELRALAGRLINAQEEERKRISRELHDDLSQKLALLALDTSGLLVEPAPPEEKRNEQLRNLQARVQQLAQNIRQLSHELHPSILDDLGLVAALGELCQEFSAREGIEVAFESEAVPKPLPVDLASCLYRVSQEALHNILKHAQASQARLKLSASAHGLHLYIQDNGVGFDSKAGLSRPGLGIVSMKERVGLVQGEFAIDSRPGHGTELRVFVPLLRNAA